MKRQALTDKILVLGIDGFEPKLAKKYLDNGKMPNLKKFREMGSCREDLMLLGAVPTVTPPLWTTLATGAYPGTSFTIWIPDAAKQSLCGTFLPKQAKKLWFGIGPVAAGRLPAKAKI